MDEICVRANLALENKKFVEDLEVSANPGIEDELEDEYTQACVQVDKVTLKLLFNLMKEEKLDFEVHSSGLIRAPDAHTHTTQTSGDNTTT